MDISLIVDNGRPWPEIRSLAEVAEELGAYAVYLCDHFMGHTDDDAVSDEGDAGVDDAARGARAADQPGPAGRPRPGRAPIGTRPSWPTT